MACTIVQPANTAVTGLLAGESLDLPNIDLNGFTVPDFVGLPTNLPEPEKVGTAELTTGVVDGTGVFDRLMTAANAHIDSQFKRNRLTGAEYARVYTEMVQGSMASAVQFLLQKDQAYWGAVSAKQQAYMANAQLARATIEAKTAIAQLAMVMAQMKNERASFALTKAKVATEEAAYCTAQFNLTDILPTQKANLVTEGQLATVNKDVASYNLANILPAQKEILVVDKSKGLEEVKHITAQTANAAQQLLLLKEQTDTQRAQTMDTRVDGAAVKGSIGTQKELQKEQITSYKRDQEFKYLKILTDSWVTQKSMDEALTAPTSFTNASIDTVMGKYRTNTQLN